jgi:hypothetical protein
LFAPPLPLCDPSATGASRQTPATQRYELDSDEQSESVVQVKKCVSPPVAFSERSVTLQPDAQRPSDSAIAAP